ncbi:hypothetical protein NBO_31g0015 [Nosema bombycis CQ1]|jgi:hypothetical protein|uniref:Uncharacterized protein n=1 Tax=Nosema bombycis (strain CQ1 / CVCC 102059) TaxID=578461 RepID=R0KVR0_NOSB1|nr:hypothetical protein NBO_31g0015 [Nosema bombycis CQ1]|eukprot:EOB14297.1 hypothetical protein NBO_31g0015 [Nosema bombycis CQ1]
MYIPPNFYTEERKKSDLSILRMYYMVCEELGIAETEKMQKIFKFLMKYVGRPKFFEESKILERYLMKILHPSVSFTEPDPNGGNHIWYNKY